MTESAARSEVVEWSRNHGSSWAQWWSECPRGDWMLAIAARAGMPGVRVVDAAMACLPVLDPYLPESEPAIARALSYLQARDADDAAQRADLLAVLDALLARTQDPAAHAATMAVSALLLSLDDPGAAATFVAATVHAAVMDAGDCGMMQAARFTEHECAAAVRSVLGVEAIERAIVTAQQSSRG